MKITDHRLKAVSAFLFTTDSLVLWMVERQYTSRLSFQWTVIKFPDCRWLIRHVLGRLQILAESARDLVWWFHRHMSLLHQDPEKAFLSSKSYQSMNDDLGQEKDPWGQKPPCVQDLSLDRLLLFLYIFEISNKTWLLPHTAPIIWYQISLVFWAKIKAVPIICSTTDKHCPGL